jgi:hypothetical protein
MVPGLDEVVRSSDGSHSELELVEVGGIGKLVCERGCGIKQLTVTDRAIGGVEICGSEKFDGYVWASRIMKLSPTSSRDLGAEAECVKVVAGQGSVTFVWKSLLRTLPECIDRAGYTRKKSGIVEEGGAVVFTGGDVEALCAKFSEVSCKTLVECLVGSRFRCLS